MVRIKHYLPQTSLTPPVPPPFPHSVPTRPATGNTSRPLRRGSPPANTTRPQRAHQRLALTGDDAVMMQSFIHVGVMSIRIISGLMEGLDQIRKVPELSEFSTRKRRFKMRSHARESSGHLLLSG